MKLRDKLTQDLAAMVVEHRGEDTAVIVEIPEIRARFEALWPLPVAATHWYRWKARKFLGEEIDPETGERMFFSGEQTTLPMPTDAPESREDAEEAADLPLPAQAPRRWVTKEELLATEAGMLSHRRYIYRHIIGTINGSAFDIEEKTAAITALHEIQARFDNVS